MTSLPEYFPENRNVNAANNYDFIIIISISSIQKNKFNGEISPKKN